MSYTQQHLQQWYTRKMSSVVLNRTTCDCKNSSSFLKQHYVGLMQIRNPVHHHIMLISTSQTLIRKKNTSLLHEHPTHSHTSGPFYQEKFSARTRSDTDGCAGSTSHSEGRNTAVRTVDGTGRKKTTPFLWDGKVLDLWKKTGGIKWEILTEMD